MQAKPLPVRAQFGWLARPRRPAFDAWVVAGCAVLLVAIPLAIHVHKYPDFSSFWTGIDQRRYLDSARAWSQLDLSPERHHYLPMYPLLGAAFVWLTPWQPFLVPDVVCLVTSLLLFVRIGRRLAPGWPGNAFALCFMLATMGGRVLVAIWVVPWSTTGSAPCQFAAVLLALRFGERPSLRRAAALGVMLGLVAGFRPSDAAVLALCCGVFALVALTRLRGPGGSWPSMLGAGVLGVSIGLLPAMVAYLAVFGWEPGAYLHKSAAIGFEWRLVPLRWIMLVADPRPLLPEGRGMAEVLPWVLPGLGGLLLGLMPRAGHRIAPAALAGGVVALHWATYLAYRDLQPYGLWRFYNVHYFKWTFPFLVLWAAQLIANLARRERGRAVLALAAAALCLCWRPEAVHRVPFSVGEPGTSLILPLDFGRVDQIAWLPLQGDWTELYFGEFTLTTLSGELANTFDFKILPVPGSAVLMPLRPFAGPATLSIPGDVRMQPGRSGAIAQIRLRFGLPCGVILSRCPPE